MTAFSTNTKKSKTKEELWTLICFIEWPPFPNKDLNQSKFKRLPQQTKISKNYKFYVSKYLKSEKLCFPDFHLKISRKFVHWVNDLWNSDFFNIQDIAQNPPYQSVHVRLRFYSSIPNLNLNPFHTNMLIYFSPFNYCKKFLYTLNGIYK